jgi:hypothetical protein
MAEKREFTPAAAETVANCTLVLQLMAEKKKVAPGDRVCALFTLPAHLASTAAGRPKAQPDCPAVLTSANVVYLLFQRNIRPRELVNYGRSCTNNSIRMMMCS